MSVASYLKFGYKVIGNLPSGGGRTFKLKFPPTGKIETWTANKWRNYKARGLLQPVDPEITTSEWQRQGGELRDVQSEVVDFETMNLPHWDGVSEVVKDKAMKMLRQIRAALLLIVNRAAGAEISEETEQSLHRVNRGGVC
jgi:hypothetical protein